jgi:hypothetical protein
MTLPRELTAIAVSQPSRTLQAGAVIRFLAPCADFSHDNVYTGCVTAVSPYPLAPMVSVAVEGLGLFDFMTETPVEVICDPLGLSLPYSESVEPEYATLASRGFPGAEL